MKKIEKAMNGFEKIILVFGILSGAVILFINVVMRNLGMSIVWAEEYAKFAIIWMTFAGCGAAVREKAHMNISAVYDTIGKKGKFVLDVFVNLVGISFSAFMLWYGIRLTVKTFQTTQVSPTMMLPMWIIYISVPIGAALMIPRYIVILVGVIKRVFVKEDKV